MSGHRIVGSAGEEWDSTCAALLEVLRGLAEHVGVPMTVHGCGARLPQGATCHACTPADTDAAPTGRPCGASVHGTKTAYYSHGCRCPEARAACAAYERDRQRDIVLGRPRSAPALGTARRLQALVALGWTLREIARRSGQPEKYLGHLSRGRNKGRVFRGTAEAVADVYNELHMTPGPSGRARERAAREGWLPPLAWDDIDDPREQPAAVTCLPRRDDGIVDEVAVDRACEGDRSVHLTRSERDEALRRLHARGMSDREVGERLGLTERHIGRERVRLSLPAAVGADGQPLARNSPAA